MRGGAVAVRAAHLLVLVAGVLVLLYPLTVGVRQPVTCRGVPMGPGAVCRKADGSAGQSYEQRLATRNAARPVVVGVGLLVAGFGTVLLVGDLRRRPATRAERSAVEDAG